MGSWDPKFGKRATKGLCCHKVVLERENLWVEEVN